MLTRGYSLQAFAIILLVILLCDVKGAQKRTWQQQRVKGMRYKTLAKLEMKWTGPNAWSKGLVVSPSIQRNLTKRAICRQAELKWDVLFYYWSGVSEVIFYTKSLVIYFIAICRTPPLRRFSISSLPRYTPPRYFFFFKNYFYYLKKLYIWWIKRSGEQLYRGRIVLLTRVKSQKVT